MESNYYRYFKKILDKENEQWDLYQIKLDENKWGRIRTGSILFLIQDRKTKKCKIKVTRKYKKSPKRKIIFAAEIPPLRNWKTFKLRKQIKLLFSSRIAKLITIKFAKRRSLKILHC